MTFRAANSRFPRLVVVGSWTILLAACSVDSRTLTPGSGGDGVGGAAGSPGGAGTGGASGSRDASIDATGRASPDARGTGGGGGSLVGGAGGSNGVEGGTDVDACATICSNACVDLQTSVKNCGRCGNDCTALPHLGSTIGVTCNAGKCSFPVSACATGWAHCTTDPNDGCETDVTVPANCGACGRKCPADNPLCAGGMCGNSCPSNVPTLCGTTCADLKSDPTRCGACDKVCPRPTSGGNATCTNQMCGMQCLGGYHACPGTTLCANDSDATHCGAQCQQCSGATNGDAACVNGSCDISCHVGYHLCSGACESNGDATHCGSSCKACATGEVCSSGNCQCPANTHTCPAMAGCFGDTVDTCGASCMKCPSATNGSYACQQGGICNLTCNQGFLQCLTSPRSCVVNHWSFESNTVDGFSLLSSGSPGDAADGFVVGTARAAQGTRSLSIPATFNCTRRTVQAGITLCNSSTASVLGKTLRFQVFVDGPALLDGPHEAAVIINNGQATPAPVSLVVGQWVVVSIPLTDAANASATGFYFSLFMVPSGPPPGNACMQWAGTIYLDDFSIQ